MDFPELDHIKDEKKKKKKNYEKVYELIFIPGF